MTYAMPNAYNITDLFYYPNTITNGLFWPAMVFTFFIIAFMSMRLFTKNGTEAFMGSSFLTMILSAPLAAAGWINPFITVMFLIFSAIGLIVKHNESQG